jgi:hypothetical protein
MRLRSLKRNEKIFVRFLGMLLMLCNGSANAFLLMLLYPTEQSDCEATTATTTSTASIASTASTETA